jgi:hypothetical protein
MEKWILVMSVMVGGQELNQAAGPFSTERNCWLYVAMQQKEPGPNWIGSCVTEREYRLRYAHFRMMRDS